MLGVLDDPVAGYRWEVGDYPSGVQLYLQTGKDRLDGTCVLLSPDRARELADKLTNAARRAERTAS